jgi:hypothetical protein
MPYITAHKKLLFENRFQIRSNIGLPFIPQYECYMRLQNLFHETRLQKAINNNILFTPNGEPVHIKEDQVAWGMGVSIVSISVSPATERGSFRKRGSGNILVTSSTSLNQNGKPLSKQALGQAILAH